MLMVASGFAGLGYQIVWTAAVRPVAGSRVRRRAGGGGGVLRRARGGRVRARRAHRTAARAPRAGTPGASSTIALWSLLLMLRDAGLQRGGAAADGRRSRRRRWQWFVAFGGTFVLFLPATAAMGATLPAMERIVAARLPASEGDDGSIAGAVRRATRSAPCSACSRRRSGCSRAWASRAPRRLRRAEPDVRRGRAARVSGARREPAPPPPRSASVGRAARRGWSPPRVHRPPGDRLRGAGRARPQPGDRGHRLHLRDAARGVSGGQRRRAPPATSAGWSRDAIADAVLDRCSPRSPPPASPARRRCGRPST